MEITLKKIVYIAIKASNFCYMIDAFITISTMSTLFPFYYYYKVRVVRDFFVRLGGETCSSNSLIYTWGTSQPVCTCCCLLDYIMYLSYHIV